MNYFARDIEHEWEEQTVIPDFKPNFLIHNGDGALPWYASPVTYTLLSLVGMSWYARMQFMGNTSYA
jgi:hypothetical protein